MEKIDSLDRQILEIISQNARIPFKDVAAECGVSRAAIHQRVQRLIDLGVIIGSGYHVNPKSLSIRAPSMSTISSVKSFHSMDSPVLGMWPSCCRMRPLNVL